MWQFIVGGLVGLVALDKAHDYITRTKGQKAGIGDIATVNLNSLSAKDFTVSPFQNHAADLVKLRAAAGPNGIDVPVRITGIGPITSKLGGGQRDLIGTLQSITVVFDSGAVKRLERNGRDIPSGPGRLF